MDQIPEILAAFGFFGAFFICPLVWMLMRHQRQMAEVIHRAPNQEALQRIQALEQQVAELRATRHSDIIREDDQRELSRRLGQ
jgi:uncharacterized membrane protein YkvA (DUF1232 family)